MARDEDAGFKVDAARFRRFSQRDSVFSRSFWDPEVHSAKTRVFYETYRKPLKHFRRVDGVKEFCDVCQRCSDEYPAKAIPHDAPRPSEIVFALVMSTGPRIHARVGGLAASEIKGEDGQR